MAHVSAQLRQIRALDLRERTIRGVFIVLENLLVDRSLPERLTSALWDAFFGFTVTAGSYRGFSDVSAATATADLRAATAARLLAAHGATRGRRYSAGPELFSFIATEIGIDDIPAEHRSARNRVITELSGRLLESVQSPTQPTQPTLFDVGGSAPDPSEARSAARTASPEGR